MTADGYGWYQVVAADGTTGWVASDYGALPAAPDLTIGDDAIVVTDSSTSETTLASAARC